MITHRTFAGGWALCANPDRCELLFHFPRLSPEQMAQVPERVLWDLCEVVDPPKLHPDGSRAWFTEVNGRRQFHRDYDLPAHFTSRGDANWYAWDRPHRGGDRPAKVYVDGTQEWWFDGERHRDGDQPALTSPTGRRVWYQHNVIARPSGGPNTITRLGAQQWWEDGELMREIMPDGTEIVAEPGTTLLG